uniref:Uncharacterized protein n=1 Tax=Rhizophora mucronata TaxID=61149 RepID=A0A2P2N698_RHIMU
MNYQIKVIDPDSFFQQEKNEQEPTKREDDRKRPKKVRINENLSKRKKRSLTAVSRI